MFKQDAVFAIFDNRNVVNQRNGQPVLAGGRWTNVQVVLQAAREILGVPADVNYDIDEQEDLMAFVWVGYGTVIFATNETLIDKFDASAFHNHRYSLIVTEENTNV